MMKYAHCIIIALMLCVVSSTFAAPSDWTVIRQADWRTHFRDVTYSGEQKAWAVGDSGVIAATTDGGKTWIAQKSGVTTDLKSVFFADAKNGWIAGSKGTLLHTTDGGAKWEAQKFDAGMDMADAFFFDAKVGWACGNIPQLFGTDGYLFYTSDGGKTWKEQPKFRLPLLDIFFIDKDTGWIAGGQVRGEDIPPLSFVTHTTDGGKTWEEQAVDLQNPLTSIYFTDKNIGWTFGMGGMFKTADSGKTWLSMTPPPPSGAGEGAPRRRQPSGLASVSFASASDIWGVNLAGSLVRVAEDGRMDPVRVPARNLSCVDFASPSVGCIAGGHGTLLTTNDGGKTWVSQAKVSADALRGIAVVSKDRAMCIGDNGIIIKSEDGGKTWSPMDVGVSGSFKHIVFSDANTGWLFGSVTPSSDEGAPPRGEGGPPPEGGEGMPFGGRGSGGASENVVLKTTDGGKTWSELVRGPEYNANSVNALDSQHICFCAGHGTGYVSNDGGKEWERKDLQVSWNIADMSFTDANNGWAVGQEGIVLHTEDGGDDWSRVHVYTAYNINSIHFLNAQKGWLAGNYGLILATDDGGETWKSQRCYSYSNLNKIYFADANNGWVVGTNGALFETKDGGKTWKQANIKVNASFYDVKKGADGAIWVTGDWGIVLRLAK